MEQTQPFEVVLSSLTEALNLEKTLLLRSDYANLPKISERKAHYMTLLDAHLSDPLSREIVKAHIHKIESIKTLAQANEKLLAAARAGVTAAQNRIKRMSDRETMVGAYTELGEKLRTHDSEVTRQKIA